MSIVQISKAIAERAHGGQTRNDRVTPYINHPAAVVARLAGEEDDVLATGWLHDVIEDTGETTESLLGAGIPPHVVDAVLALTKVSGLSADDYLAGVAANPIARKVKIADMLCNMTDQPSVKQIIRYSKSLLFLLDR